MKPPLMIYQTDSIPVHFTGWIIATLEDGHLTNFKELPLLSKYCHQKLPIETMAKLVSDVHSYEEAHKSKIYVTFIKEGTPPDPWVSLSKNYTRQQLHRFISNRLFKEIFNDR